MKSELVPGIRFGEFEGAWELKTLKEVIQLVSGQHLKPDEYNDDGAGDPYFTGPSDFTFNVEEIVKWSKNGNKAIKGDTLLCVKGSGVGTIHKLSFEAVRIGRQLMALRARKVDCDLLFQFLPLRANYFERLSRGNMIPGITRQDILFAKLYLPTLPEQQKIAAFLTAVDGRLAGLRRQVAALEQYKLGVMQGVFSGEVRFKNEEGWEFGEWKEEQIGKYLVEHKKLVDANTDYPVMTSSRTGLHLQSDYFNNREVANKGQYGVLPYGYFTYRHMSDDLTFKFNINNLATYGAISKEYPVFTTKGMDSYFLLNLLNYGPQFKRFAVTQKQGGTRTRLYFKKLAKFKLLIPSLPEQRRIATFLRALDDRIGLVERQLAGAETFKRGLLQGMFV